MPDVTVPAECRRVGPAVRRAARIDLLAGARLLIDAARVPSVWWRRIMEREHLAGLSDHLLKDIGLARADVEREARQPFWWPITVMPFDDKAGISVPFETCSSRAGPPRVVATGSAWR